MGGSGASSGMKKTPEEKKLDKGIRAIVKGAREFSKKYWKEPKEHGLVLTPEGNQIGEIIKGRSESLSWDSRVWDNVAIHTHPPRILADGITFVEGGHLSGQDGLAMFGNNNYAQIAVDNLRVYMIRPANFKKRDDMTFAELREMVHMGERLKNAKNNYNRIASEKAEDATMKAIQNGAFRDKNGMIDHVKAKQFSLKLWTNLNRTWWKNNAERFGYIYSEHKI